MSFPEDTDEWPLSPPAHAGWGEDPWTPMLLEVDAAGLSHVGKVRQDNEDHYLISRFGRYFENLQTNISPAQLPSRHELSGCALLVADGMGGEAAGEIASASAVRYLLELVVNTPDWIFRLDEPRLKKEAERRASERLEHINRAMTKEADADPKLRGYGTTLSLAFGVGEHWLIAHLGDSRVYLLRDGELTQITHDHTVAQELADRGIIDQRQVQLHVLRNRLTRLLGDQVEGVSAEVEQMVMRDGDALLLCSDGLTEMVADKQIAATLAAGQPATVCCQRLIDAALAAGGKDNVTSVVARISLRSPR